VKFRAYSQYFGTDERMILKWMSLRVDIEITLLKMWFKEGFFVIVLMNFQF